MVYLETDCLLSKMVRRIRFRNTDKQIFSPLLLPYPSQKIYSGNCIRFDILWSLASSCWGPGDKLEKGPVAILANYKKVAKPRHLPRLVRQSPSGVHTATGAEGFTAACRGSTRPQNLPSIPEHVPAVPGAVRGRIPESGSFPPAPTPSR